MYAFHNITLFQSHLVRCEQRVAWRKRSMGITTYKVSRVNNKIDAAPAQLVSIRLRIEEP